MIQPTGVHLVGSVPFSSAEEVFVKSIQALPNNRLQRIPDGETGSRYNFVAWQCPVFPNQVLGPHHRDRSKPQGGTDFECTLDDIGPTRYDVVAVESYRMFCGLRDRGVIPRGGGLRFQVSLPTPINGTWNMVDFAYRERVEQLYSERLVEDMNRLQDTVPAHDLAIQIDVTVEFAYLEYERGRLAEPIFKPYFSSVKEGVLRRIEALSSAVRKDVQLGFHLCYGDRFHAHFVEPEDAGLLVEMAMGITERVGPRHAIEWFHMPVPKDRVDAAYFDPLRKLEIGDAKLFLGLVHAHDEDGTKQRLKMAQAIYPHSFGVATECGLGRTPPEDIDSIFTICRNITEPGI